MKKKMTIIISGIAVIAALLILLFCLRGRWGDANDGMGTSL